MRDDQRMKYVRISAIFGLMACGLLMALPFDFRLGDNAARAAQQPPEPPEFVPGELVVKFKPEVRHEDILPVISACGTEVVLDSTSIIEAAERSPARTGSLPSEIARQARNLYWLRIVDPTRNVEEVVACFERRTDIVEFAEKNFIGILGDHQANNYPNDALFQDGKQWSLLNAGQKDPLVDAPPPTGNPGGNRGTIDADIDVDQAWDLPHRDCRRAIVAVFDTGAHLGHPDLRNNLWENPGEIAGLPEVDDDGNGYIDDVHGFDFTEFVTESLVPFRVKDTGGDGPEDTLPAANGGGHGTHVAGIIGAEGNNRGDIAGICWQARLMIMRIAGKAAMGIPAGKTNDTRLYFSTLYVLLQKFLFGQNVRVINLSFWGWRMLNNPTLRSMYRLTEMADILFVKIAGNNNNNLDGAAGNREYPCNSPERTPNVICVAASNNRDLLATGPGSNARSNYGASSVDLAAPGENILSLHLAGGTLVDSGTSMAGPHVSGIAALAFSLFPDKTALEVKRDILEGSKDDPEAEVASGPDTVKADAANTIVGSVKYGRLRWPYTGDLGDAPDRYLTVATRSKGALHWDIGNEFFGEDATPEVDANTHRPPDQGPPLDQDPTANIVPEVDGDLADHPRDPGNGKFIFTPLPPWRVGQEVRVEYYVGSHYFGIRDADEGRYRGGNLNRDRMIYVNAWFDLNRDGDFEAREHLLQDIISPQPSPPMPAQPPESPNLTINLHDVLPRPDMEPVFPPLSGFARITSRFVVRAPSGSNEETFTPSWIRFRLDYGENAGYNDPTPLFRPALRIPMFEDKGRAWGRARYGEVEDFCAVGPDMWISEMLPPDTIKIKVQDRHGLKRGSIKPVRTINARVIVPGFAEGDTEVTVTATKENPLAPATVVLRACTTDDCCAEGDPVITQLEIPEGGRSVSETFTGIPRAESHITIQNGDPGLRMLQIEVNDRRFGMIRLRDNEVASVDVSALMVEGDNTITLVGHGQPGSGGLVVISDRGSGQAPRRLVQWQARGGQAGRNLTWGRR